MKKWKRGALELSMNTIVVIVIGVTILSVGLLFVNKIRGNIMETLEDTHTQAKKALEDIYTNQQDPVFLTKADIRLKKGQSTEVGLGLRNLGSTACMISYSIDLTKAADTGGNLMNVEELKSTTTKWFIAGDDVKRNMKAGDNWPHEFIKIKIPKTSESVPGIYRFEINVHENCGLDYYPVPFTIEVLAA